RADRGLGDDRGRAAAVGGLPRDADGRRGHGRGRNPSRLHRARALVRPRRARRRVGAAPARARPARAGRGGPVRSPFLSAIPLFLAGIGIVFRGAAYALRVGAATARELGVIDTAFSLSSILTPFALGAMVGGIATGRVPVGNAAGDRFSSWLNSTSILVGILAVATSAYLAAVYLAADAARRDERHLARAF